MIKEFVRGKGRQGYLLREYLEQVPAKECSEMLKLLESFAFS